MYKNVYLTELIADESPAELYAIRASIREKLMAKGIPVTENIDEAHFMVVFFTRGFIHERTDILLNRLPNLPVGYSLLIWDHKEYPPEAPNFEELIADWCYDKLLAEDLEDHFSYGRPNKKGKAKLRGALRDMSRNALFTSVSLRNAEYLPRRITSDTCLVDSQVEGIVENVNPLAIEFPKLVPMESRLNKLALLAASAADATTTTTTTTTFLVIPGDPKIQDTTTIVKGFAMEYLTVTPPHFNGLRYYDAQNLTQYYPPEYQPPVYDQEQSLSHLHLGDSSISLANGLLADCIGLDINNFDDDYNSKLYTNLKILFIFDYISKNIDLKEISKLGTLLNQIGRGSMIIFAYSLDKCLNYPSLSKVCLGRDKDGAAGTDTQNRPFCLQMTHTQFEEFINFSSTAEA